MKLFIWDFHGTLEKGAEHAVREITNRILAERGYGERLDDQLMHELYGKKWYEYFVRLLPHESEEECIILQEQCIALDQEHPEIIWSIVKANDYAVEVLTKINERHDQVLISNTRHANLGEFLKATELGTFFPQGKYFGLDAHRPEGQRLKKDMADEYVSRGAFDKVVVIGDSPQDMIPLENSVKYLYAHPEKAFRECDADYRIRDLREVLREF